jgi:serine/threonine-protein kinase
MPRMSSLVGYELGNFMLTRTLGQGGMGVVYLAEHKWIARKKAVKVLREEAHENPAAVRRFFDEATAAAACDHDHIVRIEDCGTLYFRGDPWHYLEMEYLEGEDVGAACRAIGRFDDVDRAVKIIGYAADALAAAHERGIVHRDIKPENLFLARRGKRADYVKILDFGVARLTGELSGGASRTVTGLVLGTPEYMSPEQANGLHPDGRSDVYSLATVLYRMLAGRVPFEADTFTLLAVKINKEEPPPLEVLRPDAPPGVLRAIAEAMRKQVADRPTMVELQEMLLAGDAAPRAIQPELSISMPSSLRVQDTGRFEDVPTLIIEGPSSGRRR